MLLYRALCLIIDTSLFALCFGEFVMSLFKDVLNKNRIAGMAIVAAALFLRQLLPRLRPIYLLQSMYAQDRVQITDGLQHFLQAWPSMPGPAAAAGARSITATALVSSRHVMSGLARIMALTLPHPTQPLLSAMMVTIMVGHPASDLASV